eukprot:3937781-Rhodomonas_salina.5
MGTRGSNEFGQLGREIGDGSAPDDSVGHGGALETWTPMHITLDANSQHGPSGFIPKPLECRDARLSIVRLKQTVQSYD